MNSIKISIIIATYNAETRLEQCLDSIARQSWQNKEVIIQDGGSTDRTLAIASQYTSLPCVLRSEPDTGIYDAWNKALPVITGDWVLFLGADDIMTNPEALETAAEQLMRLPLWILYVYTPLSLSIHNEIILIDFPSLDSVWSNLPHGMTLPHTGTFHRNTLFDSMCFDKSYHIAGDYDFVSRTLRPGNYTQLNVPVVIMNIGGVSNSLEKMLERELEFLRTSRQHFPRAFPWRLYLRLIRAFAYMSLSKMLGRERAISIADAYRRLLNKKQIWKKISGAK